MARRRIIILGGNQAGPTAAARARELNEDAAITIVQRGTHLSFGFTGLHHHLSGEVPNLEVLDRENASFFERSYGVDSRLKTAATAIDLGGRTVTVRSDSGAVEQLAWDALIFAIGAESVRLPGVVGKNVYHLRTLEDARALGAAFSTGARTAVVVGSGSFGLEAFDGLTRAGFDVTLIERRLSPLARCDNQVASALRNAITDKGRVMLGLAVVGAETATDDDGTIVVKALCLEDGRSVESDVVIVCSGVRPRTDLLVAAGVPLRSDGTVAVNERAEVQGFPDLYACGASVSVPDAITGQHRWWAQAAIADKVAQVAGENAAGGSASCGPFTGAMVVRVGDVAVGRVGLSVDEARAAFGDHDVDTSLVPGRSHDSWFPASRPLLLELISRRSTGQVLGAEACGGDIDKRLDVLATAIVGQLTVERLVSLDLCAAGAFGGVRDVVNTAGLLASVERAGGGRSITPTELRSRSDWQIVDVRNGQREDPGLDNAIRIPFAELRKRWTELDPKRPTVVHCGTGRSGWLAMRLLRQLGFVDVSNLAGGLSALRREERQGS